MKKSGSWSRLALALVLVLLALLASGCTTRNETRIAEAQAREAQARYDSLSAQARADGLSAQAAAAAAAAEAKAAAQVGVAQANSELGMVKEQEKTIRETAWLSILPWLALIVILCGGAVGAGWLVLWYRGKAHLVMVEAQAQAQTAMMLPAPQQQQALPQPREARSERMLPGPVAEAANRTGLTPKPVPGGIWLLCDHRGEEVYRFRPK